MSQALLQMLACGAPSQVIYADDVFSAYTYTGNGSTQTITNGIDLSGQGGLVWFKPRSAATGHYLFDTLRGNNKTIRTESTGAETTTGAPITFSSTGFDLSAAAGWNASTTTYASWTFRKAPKFFDVVTWTGNGANRTISHSLGQEVGLIFVKRTDTTSDWQVYHRSLANTEYAVLNSTAAKATGATRWNSTTPTTSVFSVGTDTSVNASGGTYVAYLFAHDTASDGIVQCGTFTTDGSGMASVTLGWEPQYLLFKPSNSGVQDWRVCDSSRGFTVKGSTDAMLYPNLTSAEYGGNSQVYPTATGFGVDALPDTLNWVYLAIRRPNKPPTVGTQVYNAIARTGTSAVATVTGVGFAPDLLVTRCRNAALAGRFGDRLRGALPVLDPQSTGAESTPGNEINSFEMDGVVLGNAAPAGYFNTSTLTYSNWFFKRAPGVFDVVCYTGTGVAKTEAHNLGVVPELMIVKARSTAGFSWATYSAAVGNTAYLTLDTPAAPVTNAMWNNTTPTSTVFSIGAIGSVNYSSTTYVAYLFATKAGISKVGSYTGTATTNAIDCGFTTGARFVLIKRTDSTGDWYVWDTVRGIIAGNDPYLLLNSTAAEVTSTDYIDPYTSGFELSSTAPAAINASGGTYIYLAFA